MIQTIERLEEYEIENNESEVRVLNDKDLPSLIGGQVNELNVLNDKIKLATEAAERAKKSAEEAKQVSVGFFNKKTAIEELQEAGGMLANAVQSGVEAQKTAFEFQTKLAKISKYLFGLGASNIANTRSVIRELELRLSGASEEELSDLAQQELLNVVKQLKEQEDILKKQADFSKVLKSHHLQLVDYETNFNNLQVIVDELNTQLNKVAESTFTQFDGLNFSINEDKKEFNEALADAKNALTHVKEEFHQEILKLDNYLRVTFSDQKKQNELFQQTITQFGHNIKMIENYNESFSKKMNAHFNQLEIENSILHITIVDLKKTNSTQQSSIDAINEQLIVQQQQHAKMEQELTKQVQLLNEENILLQLTLANKTPKTLGIGTMIMAAAAVLGVVVQFFL